MVDDQLSATINDHCCQPLIINKRKAGLPLAERSSLWYTKCIWANFREFDRWGKTPPEGGASPKRSPQTLFVEFHQADLCHQ